MKKSAVIILIMISFMACKDNKSQENTNLTAENKNMSHQEDNSKSIYQFVVKDLYGYDFDFATLKGKKMMIVNTASECGNTPQYADLQKIYDTYKDEDFVVIGFPANNFGKQEPGTAVEIAKFCKDNYGVSFPMMSKISVKGNDMHKIYQFLTDKNKNGFSDSEVAWNFQKYLIDKKGKVVEVINPKTLPTDPSIISWIEGK